MAAALVARPESVETWEALLSALLPPLALVDGVPDACSIDPTCVPPASALGAWWATMQHTLLTNTIVTWGAQLAEHALLRPILRGYFAPHASTSACACVWRHTLQTCTEQLFAARQAQIHPAVRTALGDVLGMFGEGDVVLRMLCACDAEPRAAKRDAMWTDTCAQLIALPLRAANFYAHETPVPEQAYMQRLALSWERALAPEHAERLAVLAAKFVRTGYTTPHPSRTSFWEAVMPAMIARSVAHAAPPFPAPYTHAWRTVLEALETWQGAWVHTLARYLDQACIAPSPCAWPLAPHEQGPGTEGKAFFSQRALDARNAVYALLALVGGVHVNGPDAPDTQYTTRLAMLHIGNAFPSTVWTPLIALAFAAWLHDDALQELVAFWSEKDRIVRASVKQEQYLAAMLLAYTTTARTLPAWKHIATAPHFLQGVSSHLAHTDPCVRRLGMLVAECVSAVTVTPPAKPLAFPRAVWDGRGEGKEVCRVLRALQHTFRMDHVVDARGNLDAWQAALAVTHAPPAVAYPAARAPPLSLRRPVRKAPSTARAMIHVLEPDAPSSTSSAYISYDTPAQAEDMSDDEPDSSDDEVAPAAAPGTLDTALQKHTPPPVYIHQLAPLARAHDYRQNKLLLRHAAPLLRRKTGWGNEIAEHATDLCIALCAMQDTYHIRDFQQRRIAALAALCTACPDPAADCIFEQLFLPHYSAMQRIAMLHATADAAQELAGCSPTQSPPETLEHLADVAAQRARQLGEDQVVASAPHADAARLHAVRAALARPPAFAPPGSIKPTVPFAMVATTTFLYPLANRLWTYWRAPRRLYAGSEALMTPSVLAALLHTLGLFSHFGRNAARFYREAVPDLLQIVDHVLAELNEDVLVCGAALALALVLLDAVRDAHMEMALFQQHAPLLARLQQGAYGVFQAQDAGVDMAASPSARACRAAAGVVVQLTAISEEAQQMWLKKGAM